MEVLMKKINEYMRIHEAAKFLGVTANTLRNWKKTRSLMFIEIH